MHLGIVGAESKKFTDKTKMAAMSQIEDIITGRWRKDGKPPTIVSGHCHLGGVDIWAEEAADFYGIPKLIFPPKKLRWEGGFKQRNIQIAEASDVIYVIVVEKLPPGMLPEPWNKKPCYHCDKQGFAYMENGKRVPIPLHVKSGACYTAWYAIEHLRKPAYWIII